jgi:hypothetical protein
LTPLINIHSRISPRIFEKIRNGPIGILRGPGRVSTEFRQHGIPRNFLTSEVISAEFRRNSAKFRGIPRNFAGIEPEITSVFRGMPKCHFRGHPRPGGH